jgi:large subunit ribosomal protein L10
MNRAEKTQAIADMSAAIAKAPHVFLIDYNKLSVPAVTELRRQVRGAGSRYVVVKNTLALLAIKGAPLGSLAEHFTGMTAVATSDADVVALAKVLHTFGKTNPNVRVKAALVDGRPAPATALEVLASMPSRTQLLGKLVWLMQSPVRRLVTVLSSPSRGLVGTLAAIAKKKEEGAAA